MKIEIPIDKEWTFVGLTYNAEKQGKVNIYIGGVRYPQYRFKWINKLIFKIKKWKFKRKKPQW